LLNIVCNNFNGKDKQKWDKTKKTPILIAKKKQKTKKIWFI